MGASGGILSHGEKFRGHIIFTFWDVGFVGVYLESRRWRERDLKCEGGAVLHFNVNVHDG